MQLVGFFLLAFIIWFGFRDRGSVQVSPFDMHALVMVAFGSMGAVLISSKSNAVLRTLLCLREIIPGLRRFSQETQELEDERQRFCALWHEGKRGAALELAEASGFSAMKSMVQLVLSRSREVTSEEVFTQLRHQEIGDMQPAVSNWELLAKLGPAFGMVGTITGMIQLFGNMSTENLNVGGAMSLALVSTLYGVAFGAGVAGPISHYLNGLLDERLGVIERCEKSVNDMVARAAA